MILRSVLTWLALVLASRSAPVDNLPASDADAAVPPPLRLLTQADFASGVAEGLSLVEFFSPYCGHCKRFKPTWQQLVDEKDATLADRGFGMAQVDCIAQGDLCNEQKVQYYPMITLYKDGEQIEVYKGDRSLDDLSRYVDENVEKHLPAKRDVVPPLGTTTNDLESTGLANPNGSVLVLGRSSFDTKLSEGPLFVKFYAPWCGHCKKLAPVWKNMAESLKGKLNVAEVDCEADPSVCSRESIKGYPMMYFYANSNRHEYRGPRKLDDLTSWASRLLASSSGFQTLVTSELDAHVATESSLFLYLHGTRASAPVNELVRKEALKHVSGAPVFETADAQLLREFDVADALLVSLKDHSRSPSAKLRITPGTMPTEVDAFLRANRWPSAFELTTTNFRDVMTPPSTGSGSGDNIVVIAPTALENAAAVERTLAEIHTKWRNERSVSPSASTTVTFVWMNVERWGEWLKKMYGYDASSAGGVILTDHKRLVYHIGDNKKGVELESGAILQALEGWQSGHLRLTSSEGFIERNLRVVHDRIEGVALFVAEHYLFAIFGIIGFLAFSFFYASSATASEPFPKRTRLD